MPTEREAQGLWDKLRRRKVVQWGVVYAAGAWGFLQGLEYVTDTFHWPDAIQQSATLALLSGRPVVLVIAWYHGDQGRQRVSAALLRTRAAWLSKGPCCTSAFASRRCVTVVGSRAATRVSS